MNDIWENIFTGQSWGKYPGEELIRFIARNFYCAKQRDKIRIIEIGCGPGANLWFLAREGFSFVGIDGSESAIRQAAERLDSECPGWRERGELHVGNVGNIPYEDETFDAVIDNECVCCNDFESSLKIYDEAGRVLRQDGKIFVRTFATGTWGEGTGVKIGSSAWLCSEGPLQGKGLARFTQFEEISKLLRSFENISIELITNSSNERKNVIKEWIICGDKLTR